MTSSSSTASLSTANLSTASQVEQLLTERKNNLKNNPQEIVDVDEPMVKLVIFKLGEQYFAFLGASIAEVIPGDIQVYFLPGMPASVEGVMNVRGDIESVISLHDLLYLNGTANKVDRVASSVLLGKGSKMHSGLRVDKLLDVVDFPESQLQIPPSSLPEHLQPFVNSLLVFNGLPVTLLDIEAVFASWLKASE